MIREIGLLGQEKGLGWVDLLCSQNSIQKLRSGNVEESSDFQCYGMIKKIFLTSRGKNAVFHGGPIENCFPGCVSRKF